MRPYHLLLAALIIFCSSSIANAVGTPYISIDASGLSLGMASTWTNAGSLGGSFSNNGTSPQVQDLAGRRCVTFNGSSWMKASFVLPVIMSGAHSFTVAAWLYNPSISTEEAYLTWAQRGTAGRCAQFNYGNGSGYGAVVHYANDLGYANLTGNAPSAGAWHHIAVTYDGTTEKIYVDGTLNNSGGRSLNMFTSQPIFLGTSYTDSAGTVKAMPFSGSIASLKVYGECLAAGDISGLAGITTYKITGSVRADGSALAGATVYIKNSANASVSPAETAVTAADGSYSFTEKPGTYYIAVRKTGYSPKPTPDSVVTITNASVQGVDFALTYVGAFAAQAFNLNKVRLLPGVFKDAQDRDIANLLALQPDRFLHMFRQTAGLAAPLSSYGGWESETSELRGHAGGHYLSALALMYASTGSAEFKTRADYMVAELAKCQAAMPTQGYSAGYLSAFPESFIDKVETGQSVWAPYYTLHKVMAGLYDAYTYCGNQQALTVLTNMASWCKNRCDKLSYSQMQSMLNTEFGGMGEVIANLYSVTSNPDHLALAKRFDKTWFTDPLVQALDILPGIHSNTHIPQAIASSRIFELTQEERFESIAANFWDICTSAHCYPTGGTSNGEYWQEPYKLSTELGDASEESCCSYNMLKLANHLFDWYANAKVGDYIERTLINHVLTFQYAGSAMPQYAGMNSYYTSFIGGHWKKFGTPENSMWCCTGTGFEDHARYGDSIYFHDTNNIWVNLFIASTVDWTEKGVTIRQDTQFPEEHGTTINVQTANPVTFRMRVRIPSWTTTGVVFRLNGEIISVAATPGTFAEINRTWNNGDTIQVSFPVTLRMERFPDDNSLVAFFYGPVMLAGALGTENFTPSMQWDGGFSDCIVPKIFATSSNPTDWIQPIDAQALTFRTSGVAVPGDVTLIPFYKLYDQRYNLFWKLYTETVDLPISSVRSKADGASVSFGAKAVVLAPRGGTGQRTTNYFYIEDLNRAAAIRVEGLSAGYDNVLEGDFASVEGILGTNTAGERFIQLTKAPTSNSGTPIGAVEINTRTAMTDKIAPGRLVSLVGKVKDVAADHLSFTLTDGYKKNGADVAVRVTIPSGIPASNIQLGNTVSLDGVISSEGVSPNAARVILLRRLTKLIPRDISLFAYYPFNETSGTVAADASGNGRNASLKYGPTWAAGKYSNAVNLDGTDDYVLLPSGITSTLSNFTIAAWVKLDTVNNWTRIFDLGTGSGVNMFLTPKSGSNAIRYAITVSGSGGEQQINGSSALPAGSWQHVAVTLEGSIGRLYVNGVEVGRNTGMSLKPSSLGNTTANYLGKSQYGDPYLDGMIDDFRIYPTALTAAEITKLYNNQLN